MLTLIIIFVVTPALIAIVHQGPDRKHVEPCDEAILDKWRGEEISVKGPVYQVNTRELKRFSEAEKRFSEAAMRLSAKRQFRWIDSIDSITESEEK